MPEISTSISAFFKFVNILYLLGDSHLLQSSEIFGSLQKSSEMIGSCREMAKDPVIYKTKNYWPQLPKMSSRVSIFENLCFERSSFLRECFWKTSVHPKPFFIFLVWTERQKILKVAFNFSSDCMQTLFCGKYWLAKFGKCNQTNMNF